jgi:two-component system sensor histidine kinase KdpD
MEAIASMREPRSPSALRVYAITLLAVAAALGVALLLYPIAGVENVDLVFLTAVIAVAVRYGLWPSLLGCVASVLAYNFFFFAPFYTFTVANPTNVAALSFFLMIALITSNLAARVRSQALAARRHAATMEALYAFSREIAGLFTLNDLLKVVSCQIATMLQLNVVLLLPDEDCRLCISAADPSLTELDDLNRSTADWVLANDCPAGQGTDTHPKADLLYLPLRTSCGPLGVIGVSRNEPPECLNAEERRLLDSLVDQAAVAIERVRLADERDQARVTAESERLRSALLTSLSHDLRPPSPRSRVL